MAMAALACAHAPRAGVSPARSTTLAVFTGSHVPQPIDPQSGRPGLSPWLRVYDREDLWTSGRPTWGAMLRDLEPAEGGPGHR